MFVVEAPHRSSGVRHRLVIGLMMLLLGLAVSVLVIWVRPTQQNGSAPLRHSGFELNVQQRGGGIVLGWDRSAPEILGSDSAILSIRDGVKEEIKRLDTAQLRAGETSFAPSSSTVGFRLELYRNRMPISAASLHVVRINTSSAAIATRGR